jgi:group I intron endonuclease
MITGIYTIKCLKNNKYLVGQSVNILNRFSQHKYHLKNNTHDNRHLQASYNKYGAEYFVFEILNECDEIYLYSEENYWCNLLNSHDHKFGYNIKPTNPDGHYRHSKQTKEKISEKLKGYKHSEEYKKNCSLRAKGHKKSAETLIKLSIAATGKKHSEIAKQKMSLAKKGKNLVFSKEGRLAVNIALKDWLSLGLKNKKVINELTGEIYNSVSECIEKLNISTKAFYRNINGKGRFKNKYKLSYVRTIKKSSGISQSI